MERKKISSTKKMKIVIDRTKIFGNYILGGKIDLIFLVFDGQIRKYYNKEKRT